MNLLPSRVQKSTLHDLASLIVDTDISEDSVVELVIKIEEGSINIREFATYLSLTDRIYGRMSRASLRSYSLTPYEQLEITEIRKGSTEIIISEIIYHFKDATPLIIVWLFLKYLPIGIKTVSEATKNFADSIKSLAESYKGVEEAQLVRENRKKLKEEMSRDEILKNLDSKQISQIVTLLAELESSERRKLPPAKRLAHKKVKSVSIKVKKGKD